MLASATVSSDERLLPLVRAVTREFAAAAGVAVAEADRLVEAVDSAVRFVRERAYPGDPNGRIELALEPAERGIRVALHDWGRPLTSADGPEVADFGAGLDDVRLINLGAEGKRLSFIWRTTHRLAVIAGAADAPPAPRATDATRIEVREGNPDDAEPIAQLLYENYALSYVHPDFYRPRLLREELVAGRLLSSVAVDDGEVIGHCALMRERDAPVAETGVAVVAPAYRGLGIFQRLSEHTLARASELRLQALYGRAVTMHPYTQRVELAQGYHETAVCLAASPSSVTMSGIHTEPRRTALMIAFLPLQRRARHASLPDRYREPLLETYARLGLPPPAPARSPAVGSIAAKHDGHTRVGELTIGRWDEAEAIAGVRMLLAEHVDVIYADLDLEAITDVDAAVEGLRAQGFSYAGLWPHGPGNHDHLRLQRLNCTDVELEAIVAASPVGDELVRYVLADLEAVSHPR